MGASRKLDRSLVGWGRSLRRAAGFRPSGGAGSQPMRFQRSSRCTAATAAPHCPKVVVADGRDRATPRPTSSPISARNPPRTVCAKVRHVSIRPGGNVVASMEFGAELRELGRPRSSPVGPTAQAGPTPAECVSACVYARWAAVPPRRAAGSAASRIHRMSTQVELGSLPWLFRLPSRAASPIIVSGRHRSPLRAPDGRQPAGGLCRPNCSNPTTSASLSSGEMRRWRLAFRQNCVTCA